MNSGLVIHDGYVVMGCSRRMPSSQGAQNEVLRFRRGPVGTVRCLRIRVDIVTGASVAS